MWPGHGLRSENTILGWLKVLPSGLVSHPFCLCCGTTMNGDTIGYTGKKGGCGTSQEDCDHLPHDQGCPLKSLPVLTPELTAGLILQDTMTC